jgi:hypothetical protein
MQFVSLPWWLIHRGSGSLKPKNSIPTIMKLIALALAAAALASCASKPNPAPAAPTGGYVTPAK